MGQNLHKKWDKVWVIVGLTLRRWTCCSSVTTPILSISRRSLWLSPRKKSKTSFANRGRRLAAVSKSLDSLICSTPLIVPKENRDDPPTKIEESIILCWKIWDWKSKIMILKLLMICCAVNLEGRIKRGNRNRNSSSTRTLKTKSSVISGQIVVTTQKT